MPQHLRHTPTTTLDTSRHLLKIWDAYREKLCSAHPWTLATPIQILHQCNGTFPYQKRSNAGITHIYHLCTKEGLKTFPDLRKEFLLPSSFTFAYLQIKALLSNNKITNIQNSLQTF
ncbi:Hypothetical predicted protein [Pelobates cultripes]|uniref:Uncharacterized protein n=1 Tax=Pelobates cultripes TaxID=61616 RepID=A0AAD1S615_PELCU|nr:Hypothetical predicted protein [Pelobates cultripes]